MWGHFIIGGLNSRNPIDFVAILSIMIIFFGFPILYWFVFRKLELEHGSGEVSQYALISDSGKTLYNVETFCGEEVSQPET